LFSGDDINKKVKVLSGGEKTRLALSKLLLEPYNLIILDEPTNHLDIKSKEVLKNALAQYDGTLILVSHDRDFLDGLTNTLYEFKNHEIKQFLGNVFDFLQQKRIEKLDDLNTKKQTTRKEKNKISSQNKLSYQERKQIQRDIRKLTKQIETTETEIETIENKINNLTQTLANPEIITGQNLDYAVLYQKLEKLNKQLDEKTYEWEILIEKKKTWKQNKKYFFAF
jgi:ATP-binding cassette subfamily F protein 3